MTELIIFYGFSAVILAAALLTVLSKNIFHSALYLALCLSGVAVIFGLLGAYFLAGIQVLIYIGAVVVLTIFVISLTKRAGSGAERPGRRPLVSAGVALSLAFFVVLAALETGWQFSLKPAAAPGLDNTAVLGARLLGGFLLPFELVSVLLLAAFVGALAIISKERPQ